MQNPDKVWGTQNRIARKERKKLLPLSNDSCDVLCSLNYENLSILAKYY